MDPQEIHLFGKRLKNDECLFLDQDRYLEALERRKDKTHSQYPTRDSPYGESSLHSPHPCGFPSFVSPRYRNVLLAKHIKQNLAIGLIEKRFISGEIVVERKGNLNETYTY